MTRHLCTLSVLALLTVASVAVFVMSGRYPMGADVPHWQLTHWLLESLRERSIAHAAARIHVPPLDDPDMLLSGGADYNDMCAACHLRPGEDSTDLKIGLYPSPPELTASARSNADEQQKSRRQFWIIKHGIKASGMPAWGKTHDDQRIWAMVAFLKRLPELTPTQYQIITARGKAQAEPDCHQRP